MLTVPQNHAGRIRGKLRHPAGQRGGGDDGQLDAQRFLDKHCRDALPLADSLDKLLRAESLLHGLLLRLRESLTGTSALLGRCVQCWPDNQ